MAKNNQPAEQPDLQQQVDELTADLQRLQADFVNFRRRADDERSQLMDAAKVSILQKLLPAIDNIERALSHMPAELHDNQWAKGVTQVPKQLEGILNGLGVQKIAAMGEEFDPHLHEALSYDESGEGEEKVIEVLQDGYMVNDQVLRPAMVKVGK